MHLKIEPSIYHLSTIFSMSLLSFSTGVEIGADPWSILTPRPQCKPPNSFTQIKKMNWMTYTGVMGSDLTRSRHLISPPLKNSNRSDCLQPAMASLHPDSNTARTCYVILPSLMALHPFRPSTSIRTHAFLLNDLVDRPAKLVTTRRTQYYDFAKQWYAWELM